MTVVAARVALCAAFTSEMVPVEVRRITQNVRDCGTRLIYKQEKTTAPFGSRGNHICPQCGQLGAFLLGTIKALGDTISD